MNARIVLRYLSEWWLSHYRAVLSLAALSISGLTAAVLIRYCQTDPSWLYVLSDAQPVINNLLGRFGANVAATLVYVFGAAAWLLVPFWLFVAGIFAGLFSFAREWDRLFAMVSLIGAVSMLLYVYGTDPLAPLHSGGVIGWWLHTTLVHALDPVGAWLATILLLVTSFILLTRFSFVFVAQYMIWTGRLVMRALQMFVYPYIVVPLARVCARVTRVLYNVAKEVIVLLYVRVRHLLGGAVIEQTDNSIVAFEKGESLEPEVQQIHEDPFWDELRTQAAQEDNVEDFIGSQNDMDEQLDVVSVARVKVPRRSYELPKATILRAPDETVDTLQDDVRARANTLEEKLNRFGISGTVVSIRRGPVVTLYEYKPDIDTKISRILALEDDLALALQARSIRIIAPIPGTPVVGFEVANEFRKDVSFAKIVHSAEFKKADLQLPLILGEDTLGNDLIVDLTHMPHLLIAGSTGSGKSVSLNAMLVSLLYKCTPEQLRLVLIDPKRLEFAPYADIAHLLVPIVTTAKRAIAVLQWVVKTMEERYEKMALAGVRTFAEYQEWVKQQNLEEDVALIVVVIDELADLMMVAGNQIEDLIARIAQMARASGIHLIVATQRPSVDVITGLIKVNFPSRISFRVVSKVDSRTILDAVGAEKLLGRGDMLFLDAMTMRRAHGAYITGKDIDAVVDYIKGQRDVEYIDIPDNPVGSGDASLAEGDDQLYHEVLDFLQTVDDVSISLLQRRFRIGYNRSARIIDMLESEGRIIAADGSKVRKVVHSSNSDNVVQG